MKCTLFFLLLTAFTFIQCSKDYERNHPYQKADDFENIIYEHDYTMKMAQLETSENAFSHFESTPLDLDNDDDVDFGMFSALLNTNHTIVEKGFGIKKHYSDLQIVVMDEDTTITKYDDYLIDLYGEGYKLDTIEEALTIVKLFDETKMPEENQRWANIDRVNDDLCYVSYFCARGNTVEINKTIDEKYVLVRSKEISGYKYGWVKISVDDFNSFTIHSFHR